MNSTRPAFVRIVRRVLKLRDAGLTHAEVNERLSLPAFGLRSGRLANGRTARLIQSGKL